VVSGTMCVAWHVRLQVEIAPRYGG